MNRAVYLTFALALAIALPAWSAGPSAAQSIAALQRQMSAGRLSAESLVRLDLARINALNRRGPALRAIISINPDALAQARALDQERRHQGPRGPLHGVPVLLKDNIDTVDRMPTTAGSLALADHFARRDASVAAALRAAGAIILGKTNLSEWANFRSSHATSGWSAVGGLTRNPYVLDRTPCGSSSGSAVAVAAGMAAASIGTETDGSITCPASMNGIVGLKPTLGLLSQQDAELEVLLTEFKSGLNAYLAATDAAVSTRDLAQLIAFNRASPYELQFFGQDIFLQAQDAPGLDDPGYRAALEQARRLAGEQGIDQLLQPQRLDLLVDPTAGAAWRVDIVNGDRGGASYTTLAAVSGYPHLTLPMGQVQGLPVGLSLIGPAWSEQLLLACGSAYEARSPGFLAPRFNATLDTAAAGHAALPVWGSRAAASEARGASKIAR